MHVVSPFTKTTLYGSQPDMAQQAVSLSSSSTMMLDVCLGFMIFLNALTRKIFIAFGKADNTMANFAPAFGERLFFFQPPPQKELSQIRVRYQ